MHFFIISRFLSLYKLLLFLRKDCPNISEMPNTTVFPLHRTAIHFKSISLAVIVFIPTKPCKATAAKYGSELSLGQVNPRYFSIICVRRFRQLPEKIQDSF